MSDERTTAETVRCPTCRARQPWSDVCRRCQSDLRLLRAFARVYAHARRLCLARLEADDAPAALAAARRCQALDPCPESRRLMALASLAAGDWDASSSWARAAGRPAASPPTAP